MHIVHGWSLKAQRSVWWSQDGRNAASSSIVEQPSLSLIVIVYRRPILCSFNIVSHSNEDLFGMSKCLQEPMYCFRLRQLIKWQGCSMSGLALFSEGKKQHFDWQVYSYWPIKRRLVTCTLRLLHSIVLARLWKNVEHVWWQYIYVRHHVSNRNPLYPWCKNVYYWAPVNKCTVLRIRWS